VIASVAAIAVLWVLRKPSINLNCTEINYTDPLTFLATIPVLPGNLWEIPTTGPISFGFEVLGQHFMTATYRLCQTVPNKAPNCINYTVDNQDFGVGSFSDIFDENFTCVSNVSLEFLEFSPSPAILFVCAAPSNLFDEYCLDQEEGVVGKTTGARPTAGFSGNFRYITSSNLSIGYNAGYREAFQPLLSDVNGTNFDNSSWIGFCTQGFNRRALYGNYSTYSCTSTNGMSYNCSVASTGDTVGFSFANGEFPPTQKKLHFWIINL